MTLQENRFHLSRWIAVTLALLLFGCTTLTPDRIQVLAAIAGQAAQLGAQEWLAAHPTHRDAFNLVIVAINNFVRAGETNMVKYAELLESLPTASLRGTAGEVYVTGTPKEWPDTNGIATVVIWDAELKKSIRVEGELEKPVREAIRRGLVRAVTPMPPAIPNRHRLPGIVPEGAPLTPPLLLRVQPATPLGIVPETPELPAKTDAELDREFEAIKARLKKGK